MDRHWIRQQCGACGKWADIRVEENDPPRSWRRGAERRAIQISEGFDVVDHGKAVRCECGERMPI